MNISENIGTMVISESGNYIIGASNKRNVEFNERINNIINISSEELKQINQQCDTFEITRVDTNAIPCENYYNYRNNNTISEINCFGIKYGEDLLKEIAIYTRNYYNGNIDKEELINFFKDSCKDMLVYQCQINKTNGRNTADNTKILLDVYERFQKSNVGSACYESDCKGAKIAENCGGTEVKDWVYYDADYYYESEDIEVS